MRISRIHLNTPVPQALAPFYAEALGFDVSAQAGHLEVRAGPSTIVFERSEGPIHPHHFAFNIPERKIATAAAWLWNRSALLRNADSDAEIFHSDRWNADSIYFSDPLGNILEFIARHTLPDPDETPFGAADIGPISEIGVAVGDVAALRERLVSEAGISPYLGGASNFAPMGDALGLLIVVAEGRKWFPEQRVPAFRQFLRVEAEVDGRRFTIATNEHDIDILA